MKTLLCAVALLLSLAGAHATVLKLDGDLTYEITEPRCTFELDGTLENQTGSGTGTLVLNLWATPQAFPSPGGKIVGQYALGQLPAGTEFTDFKVRTTSKLDFLSGTYHFTIVVTEFFGSTPVNVMAIPTGTRTLSLGNFTDQQKWEIPTAPVISPPKSLPRGEVIRMTLKATDELNLFPVESQAVTTLKVQKKKKLEAKTRSNKQTAAFTYSVKKTRFNGKKVKCGRLDLDFIKEDEDAQSNFTITLFFQTPTTGTYESVEKNASGSETTWGVFKLP